MSIAPSNRDVRRDRRIPHRRPAVTTLVDRPDVHLLVDARALVELAKAKCRIPSGVNRLDGLAEYMGQLATALRRRYEAR
jgi:hypothetical protein